MGVWQRSAEARRIALLPSNTGSYARALPGWKPEDVVGSPYSVAQYTPDPRIGAWDDLDRVREKLRARGMALFLDFVGNHTALDHPWVREHPEFYVQGTPQILKQTPQVSSASKRRKALSSSRWAAIRTSLPGRIRRNSTTSIRDCARR